MTSHVLHGLRIASELPLGDVIDFEGEADVEIRCGDVAAEDGAEVIASFPFEGDPFYRLHRDADDWVLDIVPLAVRARIDGGLGTVTVAPGPDGREIAALVSLGAVLGLLLDLRGDAALHASAIEIGGDGVAFVGPSGAGKSTLAALACAAGAGLVADDLLRVDVRQDGSAWCYRGAPALRLRQHAFQVAESDRVLEAVETVDRRLAVRLPPPAASELPLRAIVVPRLARDATELSLDPLRGSAGVAALIGVPRFVGWRTREGMTGQFDRAARLAEHVPVVRATVPWQRPVPPSLGNDVIAALREALPA